MTSSDSLQFLEILEARNAPLQWVRLLLFLVVGMLSVKVAHTCVRPTDGFREGARARTRLHSIVGTRLWVIMLKKKESMLRLACNLIGVLAEKFPPWVMNPT